MAPIKFENILDISQSEILIGLILTSILVLLTFISCANCRKKKENKPNKSAKSGEPTKQTKVGVLESSAIEQMPVMVNNSGSGSSGGGLSTDKAVKQKSEKQKSLDQESEIFKRLDSAPSLKMDSWKDKVNMSNSDGYRMLCASRPSPDASKLPSLALCSYRKSDDASKTVNAPSVVVPTMPSKAATSKTKHAVERIALGAPIEASSNSLSFPSPHNFDKLDLDDEPAPLVPPIDVNLYAPQPFLVVEGTSPRPHPSLLKIDHQPKPLAKKPGPTVPHQNVSKRPKPNSVTASAQSENTSTTTK